MPAAQYLCPCNAAPRGAGLYTGANKYFAPAVETPAALTDAPESSYPIGSQAKLAAPFPVDRGIWQAPRLVSVFVKTPNGRWTSYPGNDVSYPTLAALALAVPVMEVYSPGQGAPASALPPATPAEAAAAAVGDALAPALAPEQAQAAPTFNPLWLLAGAGVIALLLFARR